MNQSNGLVIDCIAALRAIYGKRMTYSFCGSRLPALATISALALLFDGCATSRPPKCFLTDDPRLSSYGSPQPNKWNNYTYGEHPIVVVQGFPSDSHAILEIFTNGVFACNQNVGLDSHFAGTKVDLGACGAANYTINLKTNGVVAATLAFKVFLPDALEKEYEHLEAEQQRLEQDKAQIQELYNEIEHARSLVDRSNPFAVSGFNARVGHYNQRVHTEQDEIFQFNQAASTYNAKLQQMGGNVVLTLPAPSFVYPSLAPLQ